jgi:hypothetical protein
MRTSQRREVETLRIGGLRRVILFCASSELTLSRELISSSLESRWCAHDLEAREGIEIGEFLTNSLEMSERTSRYRYPLCQIRAAQLLLLVADHISREGDAS